MADIIGFSDLTSAVKNANQVLSQLVTVIGKVFPQALGTSTSATSGSASSLPATPAGYMNIVNPATGQTVKVPYYNT